MARPAKSMRESATPKADGIKDLKDYPFLIKTLITFTMLNPQGNEVKHKDEVVFRLDTASAKMPWYVLRNYTVPKFLTKKYGPFEVAWQRIYEIKIQKLINRNDPADITEIPMRVMTMTQLETYNQKWELGVDVTEFYSVEKAREMVQLRQSDEEGYKKHLADYREGKQRTYPELDNMRGDKDAAMGEEEEFASLEKKEPQSHNPKKPKVEVPPPSAIEEKLMEEEEDVLVPTTNANPFAGV